MLEKIVPTPETSFFDQIHIFNDFFLCNISSQELLLNFRAEKWSMQISNTGEILNQAENLNIPDSKDVWGSNNWFVHATDREINKKTVLPNDPQNSTWTFIPVFEDVYKSYNSSIYIEQDSIVVQYSLTLADGSIKDKIYKLSSDSGELSKEEKENNGTLLKDNLYELDREYLAPDGLTVNLKSIDVSDNNEGTTYYTISYTLTNRNGSSIITEGTFQACMEYLQPEGQQYGFFSRLYPGESINRSYTFRSLTSSPYKYIQYTNTFGSESTTKPIVWEIK